MWTIINHIQTIVISITLITSFINFKQINNNISLNLVANDNLTFKQFSDAINRKKYKKFKNLALYDKAISDNESNIYILGLFELSTKFGERSEGFLEVSAAQLATEHVNQRNILNGYKLNLLINDTKCDPGVGIDRYFHALYSQKRIVMLLGSGCSNVTESLAKIVPYWNVLQISFGSLSPILSDRNKFPLFFRTIPPNSSHNLAKFAFIDHFKWNTIATFSERESTYLLPLNDLITQLEENNVTCAATITFSIDTFKEQLKHLKELEIHVIVASFSSQLFQHIFCEVFNLDMFGDEYVWILYAGSVKLSSKLNSSLCSNYKLYKAIEGLIYVSHYNNIAENRLPISDMTDYQLLAELNVTNPSFNLYFAYDAIWTMALLLNQAQTKYGYNLKSFYYNNNQFVDDLITIMDELTFIGVSGPVRFEGADRIGNSIFHQIQDGNLQAVAVYNIESDYLEFNCSECIHIKWGKHGVPIARTILQLKLMKIPIFAFYSIAFVSCIGILMCFAFFYINFAYRRFKIIKLSSPRLNNIAICGCVMVYIAIILLGCDMEHLQMVVTSHFCTMRIYLLSAGFSLAFGAIFAKTYRIHRIFIYSRTCIVKDKILKDKQLIMLILVLLIIDGIVVTFWVTIDPLQRHLHNLTIETNDFDRTVVYQPQVEVCRCNNTTGWFLIIFGYKGVLLIMGVYMAWETRHIKVEALNDSQYIGICVYCVVFSSLLVLLSNFLNEYILLAYLVTTISILFSVTLTLLLLFIPKLKIILCNCEEDPIMQSLGLKLECNTRRLLTDDRNELNFRMEVQNKVYQNELLTLDREILRLETLLLHMNNIGFSWTLRQDSHLINKRISNDGNLDFRNKPFFISIDEDQLHD